MRTEGSITTLLSPSTLNVGDKIVHKRTCYAITAIKTWQDNAHGRVYALDLEAAGKTLRVSVVEGTRLEAC